MKKVSQNPRFSKLKSSHKLQTCWSCLLLTVWFAGSFLIARYAISWLFYLLADRAFLNSTLGNCLGSLAISALSLVLIVIVPHKFFKKWRTSREELGLSHLPTWTDIGLAPVVYIASLILSYLLAALFSLLPWFNTNQPQDIGLNNILTDFDKLLGFFTVGIIGPIVEELIFRGWLYGKLRAKVSMPIAAIITSFIFALFHGQWNVAVDTFALSMLLCTLREITGTIYSGILVHIIKNSVAYYLLYILRLIH